MTTANPSRTAPRGRLGQGGGSPEGNSQGAAPGRLPRSFTVTSLWAKRGNGATRRHKGQLKAPMPVPPVAAGDDGRCWMRPRVRLRQSVWPHCRTQQSAGMRRGSMQTGQTASSSSSSSPPLLASPAVRKGRSRVDDVLAEEQLKHLPGAGLRPGGCTRRLSRGTARWLKRSSSSVAESAALGLQVVQQPEPLLHTLLNLVPAAAAWLGRQRPLDDPHQVGHWHGPVRISGEPMPKVPSPQTHVLRRVHPPRLYLPPRRTRGPRGSTPGPAAGRPRNRRPRRPGATPPCWAASR
mmetsp:Transcript_10866/g.27954  ORF Transcript_10866/g.27954 Transcript_10866/m.27954 type:complete len:294 (-) Transcript_10866:2059-2940(-)